MSTEHSPIPGAPTLPKLVWPCVVYTDARAAIRFLEEAFGFVAAIVVADPERPDVIEHCQMVWPEGGGIMLGSSNRDESPFSQKPVGGSSIYVVTDDPYGVQQRALAAGATVVRDMADEDYGSTGFTVADPEANLWSFGTYRGEALP
jgi:uncharacterized glyoxalase superfamily protein PhnB